MGQLDTVSENQVLPKMDALAKIADFKKGKTNNGKLLYTAEFRLTDTGDGRFVKAPLWVRFFIGTTDDPDAADKNTWAKSSSARDMKRLFKKLGLDTTKDVDDLIVDAEDQEIGIAVIKSQEKDTRKVRDASGNLVEEPNPYAGQWNNRVVGYWTPGERAPQIYADDEAHAAPATITKPAVAKAAVVDEDAIPAARPNGGAASASPKAPEAGAQGGNGHSADGMNGGNGANVTPIKAKKEKMLTCPEDNCGAEIPKSDFLSHVQSHAQQ